MDAFDRRTGAGVLLVSLVVLALQIVLSRILAVAMGYHFVFLVVSLALLGVAAGGLAVLLAPGLFPRERTRERLAAAAALLAALLLAAWAFFLVLDRVPTLAHRLLGPFHEPFGEPFGRRDPGLLAGGMLSRFLGLALFAAAPFAAGGSVAALALARFPWSAPRVYAWDLAGAGLGSAAAVAVMTVMSPFAALGALASVAALGALSFAPPAARTLRSFALAALALGLAAAGGSALGGLGELRLVRGSYEPALEVVRWNAWSRVAAYPLRGGQGEGAWGVSRAFRGALPELRGMVVDDTGYTTVARHIPGDDLAWARWTLAALPYLLRPEARTLIVGPGGGRDILVARAMGAASVRTVEVNPLVVRIVQEDLGGFSGRPYALPGVTSVVEEGRGWLERDADRYDVIQAALVYGPTVPAAGAWTFTEDHLVTLEGIHAFLGRLDEGGILALTRLAGERSFPRLVATVRRALEEGGAPHPAAHVFVAAERGLATVLVKQHPFSAADVALLEGVAAALGYEVLSSPAREGDRLLDRILRADRLEDAAGGGDRDYLPVTDDRPYPHVLLRPADLLRAADGANPEDRAVLLLRTALLGLGALALLLAALPRLARGPGITAPHGPALAAAACFGALGLGFALVEVVLAKRLMLLLGPAPSIAVVLGAFLGGAGLGSLEARRLPWTRVTLRKRCGLLAITLLLAGVLLPAVVELALPAPFAARVAVAAALCAAIGYLMGQPFPIATTFAAARDQRQVPWVWCVSAVFGVIGASLALLVSVSLGHTTAMMLGPACYLVAGAVAELL